MGRFGGGESSYGSDADVMYVAAVDADVDAPKDSISTEGGKFSGQIGITEQTVADDNADKPDYLKRGVIARGLGRSYNESGQNSGGLTIDMTPLTRIYAIDDESATVDLDAGVSLDTLMQAALPHGLWVPVLPGTRQVTVGGAIALHMAVRHAERVAAVIASSPAVSIASDKHAGLLARIDKMEREGVQAVIDTLDNGYPAELRGDAARFASFRARWLGGDPLSYGAIYRMLIATDLQPELSRIRCPVLLTAGAFDRVRPPQLVEPVAQAIPGARYMTLQAAHYAPVHAPEIYAKAVGEFLDSVGV